MKRALPAVAVLLLLSGRTARAQVGSRPQFGPWSHPAVSPYLNLARPGTNPAVNYYGLVRPQLETQQDLQQLAATQQLLDNAVLTGRPILTTGQGARFLSYNRYFLTLGRPGSATGTGITATLPTGITTLPQVGYRPR